MLKICTGSLKEGIKELSKFKSSVSNVNLVSNDEGIYLTKIYQRNDNQFEIITYQVDGETTGKNNYQLSEKAMKAISKINETYISIGKDEVNKIEIWSEKRKLNFIIEEEYEFNNELVVFESKESFSVIGKELKVLLQTVDYVAKDETRPILQGINFKNNKVAGLDGYRIAIRECATMQLEGNYTVHNGVLKVINSLAKKDSNIKISFNEKMCKIELNKLTIYSGLMEENYIKYESLIPQEHKVNATFNIKEFKEELDFLQSLVDGKDRPLFKIDISEKATHIEGNETDSGSVIQLNDIQTDGEILIAFNMNYVKEMLKHFNEKVTLRFTSALSPMFCEYKDIKGLDLILPVKITK